MEEGLRRAVQFLGDQQLEVGVLITDRQIQKWVRENIPTTHYYDTWQRVSKQVKL